MFVNKVSPLRALLNVCGARNVSYIQKGRFDGRVAVITASTAGIGYGIAERLGKEGAKVVISSRKQKHVDAALQKLKSQGLNVTGLVCHVASSEDRKKLFEEANSKYGGIDILVSNAAANPAIGGVLDCEEESWDKIFEVNVKSSYMLAKEVLPYLRKRAGGKIVFVSSISGYQPSNLVGAYSVSKTSLIGLTKAAALQLAKDNITVNCVAPGIVKTNFARALTENETAERQALSQIPMKRFGLPEEIAATVAFLTSDDANYITGETIVPAGGMASRL